MYTKKCILGYSKLRHIYVADYDGKVVGCAAVPPVDSMAYISCVYINNNYQGMGIGKKLKAGKMFLHALLTARKFYEKLGFHIEGGLPGNNT